MKKLVVCLFFSSLHAQRDPFSYAQNRHRIMCTGIGSSGATPLFARVFFDGLNYLVKLHDTLADYEVIALSLESVTLRGKKGDLLTLMYANPAKKRPFNLSKLKG